MADLLENPSAIASGNVIEGASIGNDSVDFYIRVQQYRKRFRINARDVTGDGDTAVQFQYAQLVYGQISLNGFMIASQAIGIENLIDTTKNPATYTLNLGPNRELNVVMVVTDIDIEGDRRAPAVGVAIVGLMHNTTLSALEDVVS